MTNNTAIKTRLIIMNFLEFAVWGAYLTSMGRYLGNVGLGPNIGWFYSVQGIVSLFMPGLMGIVADRWIPAQKLLSICHFTAAIFMAMAAVYGMQQGAHVEMTYLFTLYTISVAFYMPTLALSNSVAFNALTASHLDTIKAFPPIRVFGTIGFICTMWMVDLRADSSQLSCQQLSREEICHTNARVGCLKTFPRKKDGHLLYLLHVIRGFPTNNQWICKSIYRKFRCRTRIYRYIRCRTRRYSDFPLTNQ